MRRVESSGGVGFKRKLTRVKTAAGGATFLPFEGGIVLQSQGHSGNTHNEVENERKFKGEESKGANLPRRKLPLNAVPSITHFQLDENVRGVIHTTYHPGNPLTNSSVAYTHRDTRDEDYSPAGGH